MAPNRKLIVELLGDSRSLERAFSRSSRSAQSWGRDMGKVSRGAIVASVGFRGLGRSIAFASGAFIGGAGLTAGLKASITGFDQFHESLQQAVGLAGVAQGSIKDFSRQILLLGPKVGKSPQELAKAFYFVASSGIAASKAMDVVSASAKASAAGLGETQVVADAVTSAMNAYGPSVLSAQKATDVLVATVREGKGEADAFAGVIGNVAAIASQLGVSFNEVGAALAAQTRLGVDAETSATQLQRVFSALVKVTPQQAKAFKSVGLNADTLREQLGKKGLLFVLQEVRRAFKGNLPALAKAFGDVRAVRGVLALVGNQAQAVEGIFKRLGDSAGSLNTAFDAVSKDTAQKFRQMRASAEVLGISIGAIFAPLAGKVADAVSKASVAISAFLDRFSSARTITGKLNVVWEGVRDATKGATSALGRAIRAVDWNEVWRNARGIADGLQRQLDEIDFRFLGHQIGKGFADAVKFAIPAAKDIATRITVAIRSIDFVQVGRAMGPGLATAIVTAFLTLTDPTFWAKNWDLALAVGLTVFGGAIGKGIGRLAAPLTKFASGVVERIGFALIDAFPRLSQVIFDGFSKLLPIAAKALAPLFGIVSRLFNRLGRVARFTVTVLGLQAAIDAVASFAGKVKDAFVSIRDFVKQKAIETALAFLKPLDFTVLGHHLIPGVHSLVTKLEAELDGLARHAEKTSKRTNKALGSIGGAQQEGAKPKAAPRAVESAKKQTQQVQQTAAAATQTATQSGIAADTVDKAAKAAQRAKEKAQQAFQKLFDALSLKQEIAQSTRPLTDDIRAQQKINAAIEREIKIEGRTTALARQLFEGRQALAALQTQQAQGVQFKALGLTATGEQRTPSVAALSKKLGTLRELVKGTALDTDKTRNELTRIARVLSGHFGKVGKNVREAILGMLNDISNALAGKKGEQQGNLLRPLPNFSNIAKQFPSLTPEELRRLERLVAGKTTPGSRVGGAFGFAPPQSITSTAGGFVINGPITIVTNAENSEQLRKDIEKHARRGARRRTGTASGRTV